MATETKHQGPPDYHLPLGAGVTLGSTSSSTSTIGTRRHTFAAGASSVI
jgi:hypothetical protein